MVSADVAGRSLSLETGLLAEQAGGAVVVRYGDTMLLVTATGSQSERADIDFFPLSVDYEEICTPPAKSPADSSSARGVQLRMQCSQPDLRTGRFARFPKGYRAEVQIVSTVMSADQENDPDILSIVGASAALMLSPIPFDGPVGAVRVGLIDDQIVINPLTSHLEDSALDMVVAGTADAIMMVEGEALQIPEETLVLAIERAHEEIRKLVSLQEQLRAAAGKEKWPFVTPADNAQLMADLQAYLGDGIRAAVTNPDKVMRVEGTNELRQQTLDYFAKPSDGSDPPYAPKDIGAAFDKLLKKEVRNGILEMAAAPTGALRRRFALSGHA